MMLPLIVPFLYAETHYRFKYFFSLLKKPEPEILADIPHRLEPDAALPLLLLVKDSHRYPLQKFQITIVLRAQGNIVATIDKEINTPIKEPLWWNIVNIPFDGELSECFGFIDVDARFNYTVDGKERTCINDNYRTSSKESLRIYRSRHRLPSIDGWVQGDAHTHSSYTNDQVEYGAPLSPSIVLSKAMGLSFFCVTDHSYDLDDRWDNYLVNDPDLPKWTAQQKEIDELNLSASKFAIIRGEEVSCFNRARRNVHLLLLGTRTFFSGSGDSAERWFRTTAEHTIAEVLSLKEKSAVAYAGHPTERAPFFQWLLIRRGEWNLDDMVEPGLTGIQILNGEPNEAFFRGLASWTSLLLAGKRIYISAGNDAHGNFNRFKQIGVPFFKIHESAQQLFGKMRTAAQSATVSEISLLDAFRRGSTSITNGPLLAIEALNEMRERAGQGQELIGVRFQLHILASTTEEFGLFCELHLIIGIIGGDKEEKATRNVSGGLNSLDIILDIDIPHSRAPFYIRAEVSTKNGVHEDGRGFCYTNPIWIKPL